MTDAEAMEWWLAVAQDAQRATLRKHTASIGPMWWCDIEIDGWMTFAQGGTPFNAIRQCHRRWVRERGAA